MSEPTTAKSNEEILLMQAEAIRAGRPVALCTVVRAEGRAPQRVGAKLLLEADGHFQGTIGGGAFEGRVLAEARAALAQGESRLLEVDLIDIGMTCGGRMAAFIDITLPPPRLVLFGGGHVALAIARIAPMLDFRLLVIDDRADWANAERFPGADLAVQPFDAFLDAFVPCLDDHLVVVTRGHAFDEAIVARLLGRPCAYLGMIGSAAKVREVRAHLLASGVQPADLERLDAPLGLPIGSRTPAEVAISLFARLIARRRGAAGAVHP